MKLKALCMSLLAALATGAANAISEPMGTVTVTAKPLKDKIFVGWYSEPEYITLLETKASYTYTVLGDGVAPVYPRFVTKEYDAEFLEITLADSYTTDPDGTFSLELDGMVKSLTPVKLAVSGLPSGLKYDAKTFTISGKAKNPVIADVTVKATNSSDTRTKVIKINVPNLQCDALKGLNPAPDAYGVVRVGVRFDANLITWTAAADWKVSVTGLPSGLKYDAKTGAITGVPTKAGTYTVTFTAKKGKETQVATITLNVEPLPEWVVGTFYGSEEEGEPMSWECANGLEMSVSSAGKVSLAIIETNGKRHALPFRKEPNSVLYQKGDDYYCDYMLTLEEFGFEYGQIRISRRDYDDGNSIGFVTIDEVNDEFGSWWEGYQNAYGSLAGKALLPTFAKGAKKTVSIVNKQSTSLPKPNEWLNAELSLAFGANGVVTVLPVSGDFDPKATNTTAHLTPYETDGNGNVKAWLWVTGYDWDEMSIGVMFDLTIPCDEDGAADVHAITYNVIKVVRGE